MRRLPADVERLMWLVAEGRDPRAIADFETRFPDLKADLAKHIAMVDGLKNAGRKMPAHEIPKFVPRYAATPRPVRRPMFLALACGLAVLGYGAYSATRFLTTAPPKPISVPEVNLTPPLNPPISNTPKTDGNGGLDSKLVPPAQQTSPPQPDLSVPAADDPVQKLVTVRSENIPLVAAIKLITQKAGIACDVGPGLAQMDIPLDYESRSAWEILADLGQKYGFTVLPQERGNVLIIPVRPDQDGKHPSTEPVHEGGVGVPLKRSSSGTG